MKTKRNYLFSLFIIVTMAINGCSDDEDNNITYPKAVIVRVLPKINIIDKHQNSVIIQSQTELETVFNSEELVKVEELRNIEFDKYTLLLGYGKYSNEVSTIEHYFSKTKTSTYNYFIKISGDAARPDSFRYGIIVNKLPESAKVNFEIEESLIN